MNKEQKEQFKNLYDFDKENNSIDNYIIEDIDTIKKEEKEKEKKEKIKEREKRINKKKAEQNNKIDLDVETVIGMTNKNKQKQIKEQQEKITKKQAQILKKKKKIKRIFKFISLLLLIIAGIIFMSVSPLFNIKEINVINNEQVSSEIIVSLSQLHEGENIFRYMTKKVEKNIKENPYIESLKIKRKIPNKIEIIVKERQKNYNIEALNGFAYINNQGYILEVSEQKLELPLLQGLSTEGEQIVAGNRLNVQDLSKLEVVIQIMNICKDYELDNKVTAIDVSDKNNYIIYMESEKKTIYLGNENNLSNKMLYIPAILSENQGKEGIIYLNGDINNNFKPRFKLKVDI